MKKTIILTALVGICCSGFLHAKEAYVSNIIVNSQNDNNVDYELDGPNAVKYAGGLNPKQVKRINVSGTQSELYGSYFLRYTMCDVGWFTRICKSYNQRMVVKQNAEIIWEITSKGVNITETVL